MDINVKSLVLPCGLTCVHMTLPDSHVAKVEMVVRGGFYQQLPEQVGYAHAVEHLLSFYTSGKYPSANDNEDLLSKYGITSNAWTSSHTTGYWLLGLDKHLSTMLDMLLHTFTDPHIDVDKFTNEKEAVKKELDRIINSTWYSLDTEINKQIYNNTNVAVSTQEEKENIERLTLEKLREMRDRYYHLTNMMIIVVSPNTHNQVFKEIESIIGKTHTHASPTYYKLNTLPQDIYPNTNVIYVKNDKVDNYRIQFVIKIPLTSFSDDHYILEVLDSILSDGLKSRLYKRLRDELGAVYFVSSYSQYDPLYPELSNFNITTETSEDRVHEVIDAIEEVLANIVDDKKLQTEIDEYHNKLETYYAISDLSRKPDKYSNFYNPFFLWNEPLVTRKVYKENVFSVTGDEVALLAQELFIPENVIIFYSGSKEL